MADIVTTKKRKDGFEVIINQDLCIGAAPCVANAPKTFFVDDNMKVELLDPDMDSIDDIIKAAKSCPTMAIIVKDPTGKIVSE